MTLISSLWFVLHQYSFYSYWTGIDYELRRPTSVKVRHAFGAHSFLLLFRDLLSWFELPLYYTMRTRSTSSTTRQHSDVDDQVSRRILRGRVAGESQPNRIKASTIKKTTIARPKSILKQVRFVEWKLIVRLGDSTWRLSDVWLSSTCHHYHFIVIVNVVV
jgi:hypothetical protein